MAITIVIQPNKVMTREEFAAYAPRYSIAIDGFVSASPYYDELLRHTNLDHHCGVIRDATMTAAKQTLFAIKGGLFKAFREGDEPIAYVYMNHLDQDTTVASYVLKRHELFEGKREDPAFNQFLDITDKLDITAGSYPMPLHEQAYRQHTWVFEPYTRLRQSGELAMADSMTIRANLEEMHDRIDALIIGQAGEAQAELSPSILYESPRFKVIDEHNSGREARYHLYQNGMDAFISYVAEHPNGRRIYSIGRRSQYIAQFPVARLLADLNRVDPHPTGPPWGGSDNVGGCRNLGSKFTPLELAHHVEELLDSYQKEGHTEKAA